MSNKVIIIAEAGVNHNGDFNLAKKLIDVAAIAGADYVKFQTFKADKIVNRNAIKAEYQLKNIKSNDNFIIPIACFAAGVCLGLLINELYEARLRRKQS